MSKVIDEVVLKKAITEVLQVVADNTFDFVEYESDEVDALFDGTPEDIDYYSSLISDTLVSENRIFSSKHVAELLQQLQLDCNSYADEIATRNLTTEIVTATSEVIKENVLYLILSDSATNTYEQYMLIGGNATPLGSTKIDLSDIYTKSEIDTKLADKANSSEVLAVDKVQTTTGSETNDTVYSSKLTKDELDKKVNVTDISNIINETSTDDTVPTSKSVYDTINDLKTNFQDGVNTIYDAVVAKGVTPVDNSPSSIAEAIAKLGASVYIENLIPTMTSNTSPSGLAFADNELISSYGYYAWRAFDGKTDINPGSNQYNLWASNNTSNAFIGYKFDTPTMVTSLSFVGRYESDSNTKQSPKTVKVQYSDNNSTWYDATDVINIDAQTVGVMRTDKINIDNSSYHLYWRLFILTIYGGTATTVIEMQMSGYK